MITEETVFILGAGASQPYGYPTAVDLKKRICRSVSYESHGRNAKILIENFSESPIDSIDFYLSANPDYYELGKRIIGYMMVEYERESHDLNRVDRDEDWYSYIFQEMTSAVSDRKKIERFFENKIRFITFNYDRSLEQFFYNAFHRTFIGMGDKVISTLLEHINIHHVYGLIEPSSWQGGGQYKHFNEYTNWESIAKRISIIGDERQSSKDSVKTAQEWIGQAKRVFFLGFGYRGENIEFLNLCNCLSGEHRIFGTAIGLLDAEIEKAKTRILGFEGDHPLSMNSEQIKIEVLNCKRLLRKYL